MDQNLAVAISDLIRSEIDSDVSGIDWQWNVKAEDLTEGFGWEGRKLSFPGKPTELEADGTLGGILIKAECSIEPTPGAKGIVMQIEGGYFHKLSQGGQKYSLVHPMGAYEIDIDDSGKPSWSSVETETQQPQDFNPLYTGVRALIGDIVGAKINPSAAKKRKMDRQKEIEKLQEKQRSKDAPKFDSIQEFISYVQENHEGVYGGPLLQQLMNSLYKSNDERMANKKKVMAELTAAGLKYNIRKTDTASGPESVAEKLLAIADGIDAAQEPSMQLVAAALEEVLQL
jgi:hypothetical protein